MVIKLQQYFMQCFPAKLIWFLLLLLLFFFPPSTTFKIKLNLHNYGFFCCSSYLFLFNFPIKVAIQFNKDVKKQK